MHDFCNALHSYSKIFSEIDKDSILELSQNISIGLLFVAFTSGLFYFLGVSHYFFVITVYMPSSASVTLHMLYLTYTTESYLTQE